MRVLAVLLGVLAFVVPANAASSCYRTSPTVATIPDPTGAAGPIYLAQDPICPDAGLATPLHTCPGPGGVPTPSPWSFWIYQETNGIPGLQRGDEIRDDVSDCTDGTQPDTDIFWADGLRDPPA